MTKIGEILENIGYWCRRMSPKFRGYPFYKPMFWKLLIQRIFRGWDDSVSWDLRYYTAKWIYPKLLQFYDDTVKVGVVPASYEEYMTNIYIENGHKFDEHYYRFEDKDVEKEMHHDALMMWKEDLWAMCEAFRDILEEDDDWDTWNEGWEYYVNSAKTMYNSCKTLDAKKKMWKNLGFSRPWYPSIQMNVYDFAEKKRQHGLELFAKNYTNLWW